MLACLPAECAATRRRVTSHVRGQRAEARVLQFLAEVWQSGAERLAAGVGGACEVKVDIPAAYFRRHTDRTEVDRVEVNRQTMYAVRTFL